MRKQGGKRRFIIRWCLLPTIVIFIFIFWFLSKDAYKEPEAPPPVAPVDPWEKCVQLIAEAGVPSVENITKIEFANPAAVANGNLHKSHKSPTSVAGSARIITASKLMEMVDNGEHPGPRIMHQSWKDGPLPDHFERWSKDWRQKLDSTWVYVRSPWPEPD